MRISDWSSDVCSSDLQGGELHGGVVRRGLGEGERQLFVVEILQRLHRRLHRLAAARQGLTQRRNTDGEPPRAERIELAVLDDDGVAGDRKSTRLNSSH